jgi:hypothetical protein
MTIRNRLKLIGLVPIVLLLLLSTYFFVTSYLNFERANGLQTTLKNNAMLGKILVDIGKERDLTSLYLGSDKKEFHASVVKQRGMLDQSFNTYKSKLITKDISYLPWLLKIMGEEKYLDRRNYRTLIKSIGELVSLRTSIDTNNQNFKDVFFTQYTDTLATPALENLLNIKRFSLDSEISSLIYTLSQIYTAKENSALERGLISYFVTKKSSMSSEEITSWDKFKTKANIFDIKQVTNKQLRTQIEELLNNAEYNRILSKLALNSLSIQTDVDNGKYTEEAIDWFGLQTKKITLLSKAELLVSSVLWNKSDLYLQKQLLLLSIAAAIWLLSVILAYFAYTTTRDICKNIKELEDVDIDTPSSTIDDKDKTSKINEIKSLSLENMSQEIHTPTKETVQENIDFTKPSIQEIEEPLHADKINPKVPLDISQIKKEMEALIREVENESALNEVAVEKETHEHINLSNDIPKVKKILIAKKHLLAKKVLIKVIENLGYEFDVLEDTSSLESSLSSELYDLVFTDTSLISNSTLKLYQNIAIITPKDKYIPNQINIQRGESIVSATSRQDIEDIILKYREVK